MEVSGAGAGAAAQAATAPVTDIALAMIVRVIAATHIDLTAAVEQGRFRQDLFYRLNVVVMRVAPLRERLDDLPLLAAHFVRKHGGDKPPSLHPDTLEAMTAYSWPGNVRELENAVERAVVLAPTSVISPEAVRVSSAASGAASSLPSLVLRQNLDWTERETVRRALDSSGGVKKDAAEIMGISQRALSYYLAKHRVE